MQTQKQRIFTVGSTLMAILYIAIMTTLDNNCTIAKQKLSNENSFINYVETQIGNQELPTSSIGFLINVCKSPIKKYSNEDILTAVGANPKQATEFAYFAHPIRNTNTRIFSNTDIIYPFSYFW